MVTAPASATWRRGARVVWGGVSVVPLETTLLALSVFPIVAFVNWQTRWSISLLARLLPDSLALVPLYLTFAFLLMVCNALVTRLLGWRTADGLELRLSEFTWPVVNWGRYLMTIHVVRVFAGPVFRSTPFWSLYMRLNGAKIGRLVWVNSLALMDYNLLEFGDGVVIGSVVGFDVRTGEGTQIGPLRVAPKHTELEAGAAYKVCRFTGFTEHPGIHLLKPPRRPPSRSVSSTLLHTSDSQCTHRFDLSSRSRPRHS